jgi:hypothetical protein
MGAMDVTLIAGVRYLGATPADHELTRAMDRTTN